jgi:hypothetical protein
MDILLEKLAAFPRTFNHTPGNLYAQRPFGSGS